MELLNNQLMQELRTVGGAPCLSLYMPTHRSHPENLRDPIHYKNLLKQLEESLLKQYSPAEAKSHLEPFEALSTDAGLWNHTLDGLAVLSAPGFFKVIGLQLPVKDLAVVADSLHTKPLRKYLQSVDRFQVLGISLHDMQLFEGNRHSLTEVNLPAGSPKTIKEALGDELTDKHLAVTSHGGVGGESSNMYHGHGSKKDEVDIDAERYFRVVASYIYDNYSKPSGLPLILAALPEHHNLFQQVSKNPLLLSKGITVNPKSVPIDKLINLAWEVMEPEYLQKLATLGDKFGQAKANGLGSDDMEEVAKAVAAGRVETVLLEAGKVIPGKITDINTGPIQTGNIYNPEVDDLLDDIGELVVKMGGQVVVIPPENMPTQSGLAAIFRY
jgi:DNA-binding cell septation regulator SpoVG